VVFIGTGMTSGENMERLFDLAEILTDCLQNRPKRALWLHDRNQYAYTENTLSKLEQKYGEEAVIGDNLSTAVCVQMGQPARKMIYHRIIKVAEFVFKRGSLFL
jgi:hypothetical protein